MITDRFERQAALVPQMALAETAVVVVGVGAVGRQVALQLASIGLSKMTLVDFDIVELPNLATQGYLAADLGRLKVQATAAECRNRVPVGEDFICEEVPERITARRLNAIVSSNCPHSTIVFSCVDSIDTRGNLAQWCMDGSHAQYVPLMVDGRMLGEVLRCLTCTPDSYENYKTTLFPESEAMSGRCTARATLYAASILAGLMIHQFTRWLRFGPLDDDLTFALASSELFATVKAIEITADN